MSVFRDNNIPFTDGKYDRVCLFPGGSLVDLSDMRCKHYYKIVNKNPTVEPTGGYQSLESQLCRYLYRMKNKFAFIYQSTRDNKIR